MESSSQLWLLEQARSVIGVTYQMTDLARRWAAAI